MRTGNEKRGVLERLKAWARRRLRSTEPESFLLFDKYEIIPAFEWNGEVFYMHRDPLNTLAGRGLAALMHYDELLMRCDVEYLKSYCAAVRKIFSDPKKIDVLRLAQISTHLEERVNLLAAVPDHVYQLAAVVFFTKNESPFRYDQAVAAARVREWKATTGMYDFFLRTPLADLIPSLALPENNSQVYLSTLEKINEIHLTTVHAILSSEG